VIPPSGHGGAISWSGDETPRALPVIHSVAEMERFEVARPDTGLRGTAIAWWGQMKESPRRPSDIQRPARPRGHGYAPGGLSRT